MIEQRASEARGGEEVVEQRPHWATPFVRGWMIIAAAAVAAAWDVTYQDDGTWRNQVVRSRTINGTVADRR
ncbi:hypothetical protein U6S69_07955 [Cutibacterium acnes]